MKLSLTENDIDDALAQGMDVNTKCPSPYILEGNTLLHATARFGQTSLVEHLLSHNAKVTIMNENNETALVTVSNGCHKMEISDGSLEHDPVEIVKLLLEGGADPNETSKKLDKNKGQTLLMLLLANTKQPEKRFEITKKLLEFGAKVTLEDDEGRTAMGIAKENGLDDIVALMEPAFKKEMKIFNKKAALHKGNVQKAQDHVTPKPRRRPTPNGKGI